MILALLAAAALTADNPRSPAATAQIACPVPLPIDASFARLSREQLTTLLAAQLYQLMRPSFQQMTANLTTRLSQAITASLPSRKSEADAIVKEELGLEWTALLQGLSRSAGDQLAVPFSRDDLVLVVAFMQTPMAQSAFSRIVADPQKDVALTPAETDCDNRLSKAYPALTQKLEREMPKLQFSFPDGHIIGAIEAKALVCKIYRRLQADQFEVSAQAVTKACEEPKA